MNKITVSATKRDPLGHHAQKYDNNATWNVVGGMAPNGVCATRWLRKISPDVDQLNPLARFLVENCPSYVAGKMPAFNSNDRVRVYNGKTEAGMLREKAKTCRVGGMVFSCVNRAGESPEIQAARYAENIIHCYELENKPSRIDDWLFSIIDPKQSDEEYWNKEAERIIAAGGRKVKIGEAEYIIKGDLI